MIYILVNIIVKANKYFKNTEQFLKNDLLHSTSPRAFRLGRWARGAASYAALLGGLASAAWLSAKMDTLPQPHLGPWDLQKIPLVVLDAGHGGHDGGAVAGGTLEKKLALELTLRLREELLALGLRVKMTREADVFLPLEERAAIADQNEADVFVSLHLNTSASAEVSGIETYYTENKSLSAQRSLQSRYGLPGGPIQDQRGGWLAACLQRHACRSTQATDRGIKQRNYAVVSQTQVPAALVECGFLTHDQEATRLKQGDYQKRLTASLAAGIAEFLKIQRGRPQQGLKQVAGQAAPAAEESETAAP